MEMLDEYLQEGGFLDVTWGVSLDVSVWPSKGEKMLRDQ